MNFNTTVFCTYLIRSVYQSSLLLKVRDSNPSGIVGQNISFFWYFNNFAFFISIQPTIIIRIFLLINLDCLVIPIWPETVEIFLLDSFWIIFLKSVNNRKLTSFSYFATLRTNVSDRKFKFDLKFLGIEYKTDILTDTSEDSKLVHRRKRLKVDTLFSSLFSTRLSGDYFSAPSRKYSRPLLDIFACIS